MRKHYGEGYVLCTGSRSQNKSELVAEKEKMGQDHHWRGMDKQQGTHVQHVCPAVMRDNEG